jgi:cholest-4-en-3-one 26-monooxygenase
VTTETPPMTLADINMGDEIMFEEGRSHEAFKLLRREAPISWTEGNEQIKGWWNLVKYKDVLHVSRNPQLFSSERGIVSFEPVNEDEATAAAAGNGKMLITMDPPRHVKLRRLVNKGFTPRAVALWEPKIRETTNMLLDRIAKKGESDFVIDVSSNIPLAVICQMLGVPEEDWALMFQLTNKVLGPGDPEYQTDVPEDQRGTPEAANITGNMGTMQMFGYYAQALQARRTKPNDDIISILCESEVEGEALTDEDILWFCFLLILAGNETTRNAMSGGLMTLCEHPDQKAMLLNDMSLLPGAVEEILRWVSPVMHMARVAMDDTQIGHQPIKKGERVTMWYPSVNRDEDIFPNADVFDIRRTPNEHLAFGIGEHFCLGAGFARLELTVLFEELFRRFPDIEMSGAPQRLRSTFIGGIKHLPVRFTPEV